ncbi:MAG: FtsQ-type POTRA domain-containing protein [Anaerolineales bacterium]|nr:MAG: FtsQ-type POTRA domain-containing protein [Anaerolineales bacterium]
MTTSEQALGLGENRADAVRERRVRQTRRVERADRIQTPKPKRKRTPRRRYSVRLGAERGAEMQFVAIPAGSVGTRLFSLVIAILSIGSLVRFARSERFRVDQIAVEGAEMLTVAQIRSLAGVEGQSIFFLDPAEIANHLGEAAEVKAATIKMAWPNRVEVQVQERHPAVEWNDAGRLWWLSSDGVAYVQHGDGQHLVQIRSEAINLHVSENAQDPVVDPGLLRAIAALSKHLPEVQSWIFDQDHGLGFTDASGGQVYFGTGGDMPMKVRIYHSVAEKLAADNVRATLVSIEDQAAPYYSVR